MDPFPLWRQLTSLNEIFTDPTIVKVFHGGDNDLVWLQRDFSVYVVNMFDTHQAAIRLNFPIGSRGYKSVLKHYCKVMEKVALFKLYYSTRANCFFNSRSR